MKKPTTKPVTKKAIASALGISRTTLDRYLELEGAPKESTHGWDLSAVSKFISEKAKTNATGSKSNPQLAELKIRELQLRCERLSHRLDTDRGLYIPKSVIGPALRNLALNHRAQMQRKLEQELPARLVNRTEIEIIKEMKTCVDDLCRIYEEGTLKWMQAPP